MPMSATETKRGSWEEFLLLAADEISLSPAQYKTIDDRYSVLQDVLSASSSPLLAEAHIFVQGSMGLKTTIKPVSGAPEDLDTIDADAVVWLPHAQEASAQEVLETIEKRFVEGSRVEAEIKQLRRGVRVVYADENPGFHIDVTPARAVDGNPEEEGQGRLEVPDRETGWKASSPRPYSSWLESASARTIAWESYAEFTKGHRVYDSATQDPLPAYEDYADGNALRATIKLLKRHRDEWAIRTGRVASRPISAVITTLATHAYLDVAQQSMTKPLRPLDAILAIVRRMPDFVQYRGRDWYVCNPKDPGENFAEKWNRPQEGEHYRAAFSDWHASASESVSLGLENFDSNDAFEKAINESFGIGPAFVKRVNNSIPANWTLPGRPEGTTRNLSSMSLLLGGASGSSQSQAAVKPVGRLG